MASHFKTEIRSALNNQKLKAALDANSERRKKARIEGYKSLPENLEIMRLRAHEIRKEVIENLEKYLEEFTQAASSNGMIVHRAESAKDAVDIVLQIAKVNNARLIAKSKTMIGEEIHINKALESAGIEVVETDLGEYIVQLRKERPSHIITPAVHLQRSDVGRLFNEKLGLPYTDDVSSMVAAARNKLREVFLDADVGISGVNFGVVEDGCIVLVTNEGNGRMVTTLPRIHIALMGIERLVPDLDDLAHFLYLLPRSASGQKMAVYTNILWGPRRNGDPDGPTERHLILLDNGRSDVKKSKLRESLFCIRCGACLNICPVFREIGGHAYISKRDCSGVYPGPIGSVLMPSLFNYGDFNHLVRACSLCGACKEVCPVITDFPQLILSLRAGVCTHKEQSSNAPLYLKLGIKLFKLAANSPRIFITLQRSVSLLSKWLLPWSAFLRPPRFTQWGISKDIPKPAAVPFRKRFHVRNPLNKEEKPYTHFSIKNKKETMQHYLPEPLLSNKERFYQEATAVGGEVILCRFGNLVEAICEILAREMITSIQAWNKDHLPIGVLDQLQKEGISIIENSDPSLRVGLTGSSGGIADSGTLIIPGGRGKPLSASLLPEIHLAVIEEKDIYSTLRDALHNPDLMNASATVLITGPSRTADIEMTLSIGMHGPKKLFVFLLSDS
jgi:L-lactate dehydrogenase complex protein LldF